MRKYIVMIAGAMLTATLCGCGNVIARDDDIMSERISQRYEKETETVTSAMEQEATSSVVGDIREEKTATEAAVVTTKTETAEEETKTKRPAELRLIQMM